ncbi:glycosyltransferase WbuB [Oxalobacteraceae bacterium CAVE-383]|nr:glycosyltransferase WbuB [Oxalobacteraceae bacterium CAVE-383]
MRLLVITQYFWPENFRINDLVEGLLERGHDVTVLTGLPNYPSGQFAEGFGLGGPYRGMHGKANVIRVPMIRRGKARAINLILNYFSFALSASIFGCWRCKGKYDAIFVFEPSPVTVGIPARVIGKIKSVPILFWIQDLWPESLSATGAVTSPRILKVVEKLVRWIYRGCALVLVQSEAFIPAVTQLDVMSQKIRYFPNSAENMYRLPQTEIDWNGPQLPTGFRVMFAGNIGVAQSMETIMEAAELLKGHSDIHWIILGDGRLSPWLREEVAKRNSGGWIHLMGRFPVETMPNWFSQADVLLVTLRKDPVFASTIPSKIQSYLACGKPIAGALDGEGARILESSGAGIAAPAGDAKGLADAVLKLYKMSATERRNMGANGNRYYQTHFDRTQLLDRLEDWLREVVMEKNHA